MPAGAQTSDTESVIVTPEAPKPPDLKGGFGDAFKQTGRSISDNLDTLSQNLGILHDLNSQANQDAIDRLGKNYGNLPSLGAALGAAISNIDTPQLTENSQKFARNINDTMASWAAFGAAMGPKFKAEETTIQGNYSPQNLPNQAQAEQLGVHAKQLAQNWINTLQSSIVTLSLGDLLRLNNDLSTLNTNVVSINKTYLNLIKLTESQPSTLAGMPDLPTELGTLNNLAAAQMPALSGLGNTIGSINAIYSEANKRSASINFNDVQINGDKKDLSLKDDSIKISGGIRYLTNQLSEANNTLGVSLGTPAVVIPAPSAAQAAAQASATPTLEQLKKLQQQQLQNAGAQIPNQQIPGQ
jgi:hypothetical protein